MSRKNGATKNDEPPYSKPKAMTVKIPGDLVDEARAAAAKLGGYPHQLTLSGLVADAIREHLDRLSKLHNRGRSWGRVTSLKRGRPVRFPAE